jgi:glycosyltransferase involved in cell wall biosynthesis
LEIADKMRQSDAFVLFSRYENLPCVLLEAMACGLHIISTQVGGIREHVHASFGTLIDSEDEAALTEAMLQFIHHSDQPLVNTDAQHYAASHFSMDAIAQQYDQVYRDLGR